MSYHKGGGISDAELSIINSVDPFPDRPTIMDGSIDYSNSFVGKIRNAGYLTIAYHGNTGKFWNRSVAFPAMGYERFVDAFGIPLEQAGWGIPDHLFFPYVLEQLKGIAKSHQPFFAYVITMSTHESYQIVKGYYADSRFETLKDPVTKGFFLSMEYLDKVLSKIVPELRRIPDTEIILVGDHASIEMDGFVCSRVKHGPMLLDFVPLNIVSSEDDQGSKTVNTAASFMDLGITILELSAIPCSLYTKGLPLLNPPEANGLIVQDNLSWTRNSLYWLWKRRASTAFPNPIPHHEGT
jgi:phosphoglycerol transferase MdoB-like AlkP superfamily enzyme